MAKVLQNRLIESLQEGNVKVGPSKQSIKNILAYSKSLEVKQIKNEPVRIHLN